MSIIKDTQNILIVEDEPRLNQLITKYLQKEGYNTYQAKDGFEALERYKALPISLVLLDIMLPKLDGWTVCKKIREIDAHIPIILITSRADEEAKIKGFELGVDQYVTKPFSMKELLVRVKSVLKKHSTDDDILRFNQLMLVLSSRKVYVDDKLIELTVKEYDLLYYLAQNYNHVLSREQILSQVWGYDYEGDDRTVDTHIKRLRKKLSSAKDMVKTVRGIGYRLEVTYD